MHSDTWPVGGEIDVFEGINLSKYVLHGRSTDRDLMWLVAA